MLNNACDFFFLSANMKKLGIEARKPDIALTASSSYGNGPGTNADKGRLNAMIGGWASHNDGFNFVFVFLHSHILFLKRK